MGTMSAQCGHGSAADDLGGSTIPTLLQTLVPVAEQRRVLTQMAETRSSSYQTQCLRKDRTAVAVAITTRKIMHDGEPVRLTMLNPQTDDPRPFLTLAEVDLTPRQLEMLTLLANGLTDQEIAKTLNITKHTVKRHNQDIYDKLHVGSRSGAMAWFWKSLFMPEEE